MSEESPQTPTAYSAELDSAYTEAPLKKLRRIVAGNGADPADVALKNFKGETLEFIATTRLTLETKILRRTVGGKIQGPVPIEGPQALNEAVGKEREKITHRQDIIKRIKDVLLEREDRGFGLENELISLPFLHKEYVYYEDCKTCRGQGKIKCARCGAQGYETCPQCQGQGQETCPRCTGNRQMANPQGGFQNCTHCQGQGKVQCTRCQQNRRIPCSTCKTKRTMTCTQCNGHKWNSHVATAQIDAMASSGYDVEAVPERIQKLIERLGDRLADHVQINVVDFVKEPETDVIDLPFMVRIPHGDIEFSIKETEFAAFLFGTKSKLIDVPPFLEGVMGPGINALAQAAKGEGNPADHLKTAAGYRTLRDVLTGAARYSPQKTMRYVLRTTPFGLKKEMIKTLIENANAALKILTQKSRFIGMGIGGGSGIALGGIYFATPLRGAVLAALPGSVPAAAGDALFLALAAGLGFVAADAWIKNAKKTVLKNLMP